MYHYKCSGLDYIWLRNGYETVDTEYGEGVMIHNLDGLHRAISTRLVEKASLTGMELRFLRIELNMSQQDLADVLEVNESTFRNWESGRTAIPGTAAQMVKILYLGMANGDTTIREALGELHSINQAKLDRLELEEVGEEWKMAA